VGYSTLRDELARDEERSSIWTSLLNQALGRFSYEWSTAEKTRTSLTNNFSPEYLGWDGNFSVGPSHQTRPQLPRPRHLLAPPRRTEQDGRSFALLGSVTPHDIGMVSRLRRAGSVLLRRLYPQTAERVA
jgi:hypothetical protein